MKTGGKTSQVFGIDGEALLLACRIICFLFLAHSRFRFRLRLDHMGLIKTSTGRQFLRFATQKFVIRRFLFSHLSPDISTFFGFLYNAFILGFLLASRYGGGWHAQNGMEMDDLSFFPIRTGAFEMDMLARLAFWL
jgi:hypothetical protein